MKVKKDILSSDSRELGAIEDVIIRYNNTVEPDEIKRRLRRRDGSCGMQGNVGWVKKSGIKFIVVSAELMGGYIACHWLENCGLNIGEGEVWVREDWWADKYKRTAVIMHELIELVLMIRLGWNYSEAHSYALDLEKSVRLLILVVSGIIDEIKKDTMFSNGLNAKDFEAIMRRYANGRSADKPKNKRVNSLSITGYGYQ
jgi:hypothetical protein